MYASAIRLLDCALAFRLIERPSRRLEPKGLRLFAHYDHARRLRDCAYANVFRRRDDRADEVRAVSNAKKHRPIGCPTRKRAKLLIATDFPRYCCSMV